jgi:hypothetical protein
MFQLKAQKNVDPVPSYQLSRDLVLKAKSASEPWSQIQHFPVYQTGSHTYFNTNSKTLTKAANFATPELLPKGSLRSSAQSVAKNFSLKCC